MPPKSKKKKAETDKYIEVVESADEDSEESDTDYSSDEPEEDKEEEEEKDVDEEEEDDADEEEEDDADEEEEDDADEELNESDESEDSENEEEKRYALRNERDGHEMSVSEIVENKREIRISRNHCTKNHRYQTPSVNVKDVLNGSCLNNSESEAAESDKNEPAFENVSLKWGWKQEVMLLEGIQSLGLFKWEQIAAQLTEATGKTFKAEEVKNHYYQYYYNGTLGQVWNYELDNKPLKHFDHTDPIVRSTNKYLPAVAPKNLKEIKFLPHREDFEEFPPNDIEMMNTTVDFSSHFMNSLKANKIDQEVRNLQLVIVDSYRKVVAERMRMQKLMKNFKLIEQFFYMDCKITKKCYYEVEKRFNGLQHFIHFYDSPDEFIEFYNDCVKERVLKLEIDRLYKMLVTKRKIERNPEINIMLKKRAPSFLDVGLFLNENKDFVLEKSKKRKKKFKFTQRKRTR